VVGPACAAVIESDQCAAHLDQILAALSTSTEFAVDVIATTESSGNRRPWHGLTCDQLATLHLWACTTLPPGADHPSSGVVPSNPVYEFAEAVLRSIQERVEPDAVDALNRIADGRDYPWARSAAVRIANQLREAHWQPLPPADVLAVIDEPGRRVIASEAQLAQLLLEAIEDIQAELDGSPDFAALFWHRQHAPKGQATTWMPRSEVEFATALLGERLVWKLRGVVLRQEAQLNLRYGDTEETTSTGIGGKTVPRGHVSTKVTQRPA